MVNKGDIVEQGKEIALSGQTGNTTGPHLHFEIRMNNQAVNPRTIIEF
jgi:murein DD-endopeptidase MepM/ murein hydrolase activator NlpD